MRIRATLLAGVLSVPLFAGTALAADTGTPSLANAAKRYRVDTEKVAKTVAQEFAAKHKKQERKTVKKKVVAQ